MQARLDEAGARVRTAIALADGISSAVDATALASAASAAHGLPPKPQEPPPCAGSVKGHPRTSEEHGRGNTDSAKARLRQRIASDPGAFFAHADTNNDQSLSWDEWQTACAGFLGDVEPGVCSELFKEMATHADGEVRKDAFIESRNAIRLFVRYRMHSRARHACMHACTRIRFMHASVYVCVCVCECTYVCNAYMHMHLHKRVRLRMGVYVRKHVRTGRPSLRNSQLRRWLVLWLRPCDSSL